MTGIVEVLVNLRSDFDSEGRATQRHWAKRETQLNLAMRSVGNLYGNLQGIIGAPLPGIAALEASTNEGGEDLPNVGDKPKKAIAAK